MIPVRPGRTDCGRGAGALLAACGTAGALDAGGSRAAAPPASLDQDNNKSTKSIPDSCYVAVGCGCRSWWCARCGPKLGRALRARLLNEVEGWKNCIPITLTLGRWVGEGNPERAWQHVAQREKIRKLMKALGSKRWVWFLEPQSDGYPHWHVLAEIPKAASVAGLAEVRRRIWSFWGPSFNRETGELAKRPGRWDLGIVHIDGNKLVEQGPRAVVAYCTSYVTKAGDVPAWMLDDDVSRRVRKFGASRAVGALRADSESAEAELGMAEGADVELPRAARQRQCLRERLAWCGHRCQIFYQRVDRTTGEVQRQYVCDLEMSAINGGFLRKYLGLAGLEVGYWVLTSDDGQRTWVAGCWFEWGEAGRRDDGAVREALNVAVYSSGVGELTREDVDRRRRALLAQAKGTAQAAT